MNNRKWTICILSAALLPALGIAGCGANISSPVTRIKTGPVQTVEIHVPMPEDTAAGATLNLEFTAGELNLSPGGDSDLSGELASGTATFNAAGFEPKVEADGSSYTLSPGDVEIEGIPVLQDEFINRWDLHLAGTPMSLNIQAGAYTGIVELGGLSLQNLTITDGGADFSGAFSEPNQVAMESFTYKTGASSTELKGLANANFNQMTLDSGAGDCTLSFDGDLQHDASVMIDSGLGTVNIIVPEGVNARLTFDGGLSTVNAGSGWQQDGSSYTHSGSGPTLAFTVKMGAGTLNLESE